MQTAIREARLQAHAQKGRRLHKPLPAKRNSLLSFIKIEIQKRLKLIPPKKWSNMILIMVLLAGNGCHKNVLVPYIVKNNLDQKIYVAGQKEINPSFNSDTTFCIPPSEKQIVLLEWRYCLFGNCRLTLQDRNPLGELSIYQDTFSNIKLKATEIKIKRQKVIINISEKK